MTQPDAELAPAAPVAPAASRASASPIAKYPLEFVGTGGEYFNVWIVNVVLTVLTVGFFTPFARRRTAVYFYNHTLVADSALEFTGSIKRMLLGFLVVTTLYVLYELAGYLEYEWAVNFMLVLAALAAPFLWGSAMRFRTRSTRWRGIRPLFVASWREIYQQSWPIFAIALVWIAIVVGFNASGAGKALEVAQGMEQLEQQRDELLDQLEGDEEDEAEDSETPASGASAAAALIDPTTPEEAKLSADYEAVIDKLGQPPYDAFNSSADAYRDAFMAHWPVMAGLLVLGVLASLPFVVLLEFNYRRLFVLRTQIGNYAGHWKPMYRDFLRVWLATFGVSVLIIGVTVSVLGGAMVALIAAIGRNNMAGLAVLSFVIALLFFMILAGAISPIRAYKEARVFQLLWNNIGVGPVARFKCDLRTWAFVRLRIWNLFLSTVTLGFYRPFARVAEYRMKLESVTLYVKGNLDDLEGRISQEQGALGDAFADMMGMDLIT